MLFAALHLSLDNHQEDDEYRSPLTPPSTILHKVFWVVMLPVSVLFWLTIPDVRRPGCWSKLFMITFTMSIVWIAAMSYVMVWMVTIVGMVIRF